MSKARGWAWNLDKTDAVAVTYNPENVGADVDPLLKNSSIRIIVFVDESGEAMQVTGVWPNRKSALRALVGWHTEYIAQVEETLEEARRKQGAVVAHLAGVSG